jgi:hypothetical protein
MWLEIEIDGIKVYMPDLIGYKDAIETASRGIVLVEYSTFEGLANAHEIIENWIEGLEKSIAPNKEKILAAGFKYLVLMTLGEATRYKPKRWVSAGMNMVLAFYKRRPKFIQDVRPYP